MAGKQSAATERALARVASGEPPSAAARAVGAAKDAARAVGAASQAKSNQEEGLMKIFSKNICLFLKHRR